MSDHDDIMAVEQTWNDTYLAGDVGAFSEMLHEDFVYSSERGVFTKHAYAENLASGAIDMRNIESFDQTVRLLEDVAVVTGSARLEALSRVMTSVAPTATRASGSGRAASGVPSPSTPTRSLNSRMIDGGREDEVVRSGGPCPTTGVGHET